MPPKIAALTLLGAVASLPGAAPAQIQGSAPAAFARTRGRRQARRSPAPTASPKARRGRATRNGQQTGVALDFRGNVFGGTAAGAAAPGTTTGAVARHGGPGSPPGTAAGRAAELTLGANPGASGSAR